MLQSKPNERRSAGQVYGSLKGYEEDILDLRPFITGWGGCEQRRLNQISNTTKMNQSLNKQ